MASREFGLDILVRVLNKATAPIRQITNNFDILKRTGLQAQNAFDLGAKLRQSAQAVSAFSQKTRALVQGPVDLARDFDHAMNVLASTLHVPRDDIADLAAQAKQLGQTTKFSALEAAQGMYALANAGLGAKEIYAALPHVMDLAATNEMDLATAATGAARMMQGLHLEAAQMQRVVDAVAKAGVESTTSVSAIAEAMEYASGVARQYNISLEQTAALIEGMSSVATGSAAGTDVADILTRLAAPHGRGRKAMAHLHLKVTDDKGNLKPIIDILEMIDKKTAGLGTAQRGQILEGIFGQVPQRGIQELLSQVHTGNLQRMEKSLHDVGYASRMASQMMSDATGAQKKLSGATETLQISLGEKLLPRLTQLQDKAIGVVERLTAWSSAHSKVTTAILVTTAAIGGLSAALAGLLISLATVSSALGVLSIATGGTATGAQILGGAIRGLIGAFRALPIILFGRVIPAIGALAAALATNPITWIVLGVAALVAGLVVLVKHWRQVTEAIGNHTWAKVALVALGSVTSGLSLILLAAVEVTRHWSPIKAFFSNLWDTIGSGWQRLGGLRGLLASVGQGILATGQAILRGLKTPLGTLMLVAAGPVGWLVLAGSLIAKHWDSVKVVLGAVADAALGFGEAVAFAGRLALSAISYIFSAIWSVARPALMMIWTGIVGLARRLWEPFAQAARDIGQAFSILWEVAKPWLVSFGTNVAAFIKQIWADLTDWDALNDAFTQLWDVFKTEGKLAIHAITDELQPLLKAIDAIRSHLPSWAGGTDENEGSEAGNGPAAFGPPGQTLTQSSVRHEVGGTIHVQIDSDKPARVRRIQKRGAVDLSVDTGYAMGTP